MVEWKNLEERVRQIAGYRWNRACGPKEIAGINLDNVIQLEPDYLIIVEVTVRRDLDKVRYDINRLLMTKMSLANKGIFARCYCVTKHEPTHSMTKAGEECGITVVSVERFCYDFFDYDSYLYARRTKVFGSSANPYTGEPDNTEYIPVQYRSSLTGRDIEINDIEKKLIAGKSIVLLGDYGTGKSRCAKELFLSLAQQVRKTAMFPIAINLRNHWGLKRASELIRRHLDDLGLSEMSDSLVRGYAEGMFCFILDGFDEIGSQSWSTSRAWLRKIRKESLEGVRDLIQTSKAPVFIAGREHYFNSSEELYESLGIDSQNTEMVSCYDEFNEKQMSSFLARILPKGRVQLPSWLPRRPLICQVVARLTPEQISRMLEVEGKDDEFWDVFISTICKRESNIRAALDHESIRKIMRRVARFTREKSGDVGPISVSETSQAFQMVVGRAPVGESSLILQRLPGLGRVESESDARQFIDVFVLDGLRAEDLLEQISVGDTSIFEQKWMNPLRLLGYRILAKNVRKYLTRIEKTLHGAKGSENGILLGDLVGGIVISGEPILGGTLDSPHITTLDLTYGAPVNLVIKDAVVERLILPLVDEAMGFEMTGCCVGKVFGASSERGLPPWLDKSCDVESFEDVTNTSAIKNTQLSNLHQILVSIIKKTFFQPGSGRKEASLFRGFGDRQKITKKITKILVNEGILEKAKGDEGALYIPMRRHTARMEEMLANLNRSQDPLWLKIAELSDNPDS